jgi:GNAT superfamily N-acetyltransferase
MHDLICREMREGDEGAVSHLVQRSFHRYIAHHYRPEGIDIFLEDTSVEGITERMQKGQLLIVAETGTGGGETALVGVIAVRSGNHISLFFVDEEWYGRGVARALLKEAIRNIRESLPDVEWVTVNSSPYAVGFYTKMGFHPQGQEQYRAGMLVTPMVLFL